MLDFEEEHARSYNELVRCVRCASKFFTSLGTQQQRA
jgi:hypothetical protein